MAQFITFIGGDRVLALLNGNEFARTMSFGTKWNKLRIALRCSITGNASGTANLIIGLCSGASNTFKSTTTTDYIGCKINGSTFPGEDNITFGSSIYTAAANGVSLKRVNNTTNSTTASGGAALFATNGLANNSTVIVDVVKNSTFTPYVLSVYTGSAATGQGYLSQANFWLCTMNENFLATLVGLTTILNGTANAYSPNTDLLDTVSIYWTSASSHQLWISDLMVIQFY